MNKPMIISKDYFEHLLNCLANQKYNPPADDQTAIDKAYHMGMKMLQGAKFFNWEADADEHEAVMGASTPNRLRTVPALSPPDVKVITFNSKDGPGIEQSWIYGISWTLERGPDGVRGSIITAVDDRSIFQLLNQEFAAIVLQSPQAALMIKGVNIVKYGSGISIEDITVDEAWEFTYKEITGWRKEPYVEKEGEAWKLKS
jgi:hypothetical protein